jgi:hypothetical protein
MEHKNEVQVVGQDNIFQVIAQYATAGNVNVDVMSKLLDMQERVMNKQAEVAFNQAMTKLQSKLPTIRKDGKIEFTDKNGVKREIAFARYEDIDAGIRPLLIEEGFSISFNTQWADSVIISGTLAHKDGHSRTSSMRLPLDTSGSKNNLQAMGSTTSYGKRYLVGMLLNIVTKGEDDDGKTFDIISFEEAAEIDNLINETKSDRGRFLKYMGVDDVLNIKSADYKKAITALNAKKRKQQ